MGVLTKPDPLGVGPVNIPKALAVKLPGHGAHQLSTVVSRQRLVCLYDTAGE